jgi:plastocyanin
MPHDTPRRRTLLARGATSVAAAGALATAGCITGDSKGATTIEMTPDFAYAPTNASVTAGERIEWSNESDVGHTVTAYDDGVPTDGTYFASGGFDDESAARGDVHGGIVEAGETYAVTLEVPGTYEYFCVPHEGSEMVGTVEVTDS